MLTATKIVLGLCLVAFSGHCLGQEKLVDVNGIQYNVLLKGLENRKANSPVIVLEGGMGSNLHTWDKIIDQLAGLAAVFAYDRANIGKSGKTFEMPTIDFVSKNLHNMLAQLKIAPPYVLIGHSLGGVYIRSFAGFYPGEVAGLVFIDPADFTESKKDWNAIFSTLGLPDKKIDEMLQNRLYKPVNIDSARFGPSSEAQALTALRRDDFKTVNDLPLPKVPIYFFVGGKFEVPVERRSKEYDQEAFFHIKNNSNMDRWKKLIYLSGKGGALLYLTNAGHYIQNDAPGSLIANISVLLQSLQ